MGLKLLTLAAFLSVSHTAYSQSINTCSSSAADPDGDGFGWENNESCRVTEQSDPVPQFINKETGQPVTLVRAYWNSEDFYEEFKDVVCKVQYFNGIFYEDIYTEVLFEYGELSSVAPFQGRVTVSQPFTDSTANMPWGLDNGTYSGPNGLATSPWVEIIDLGYNTEGGMAVRIWQSSDSYSSCRATNPNASFVPTGSATVPEELFTGVCIDTDPVGDGWGWDGSESCRIPQQAVCVDSAPVGDGWGWDGTESCQINVE